MVFPLATALLIPLALAATTNRQWHTSSKNCDEGWVYSSASMSCYKYNESAVSWMDAERDCQRLGGHIASVHSEQENSYLRNFNQGPPATKYRWLGLRDNAGDCEPIWSDGSNFTFGADYIVGETERWREPRRGACRFATALLLGGIDMWEYRDRLDDQTADFVCQKPAKFIDDDLPIGPLNTPAGHPTNPDGCATMPQEPPQKEVPVESEEPAEDDANCDFGWRYFAGTKSCYKYMQERMSFQNAYFICLQESTNSLLKDAALTSINSQEEFDWVTELAPDVGGSAFFWVGIRWGGAQRTANCVPFNMDGTNVSRAARRLFPTPKTYCGQSSYASAIIARSFTDDEGRELRRGQTVIRADSDIEMANFVCKKAAKNGGTSSA